MRIRREGKRPQAGEGTDTVPDGKKSLPFGRLLHSGGQEDGRKEERCQGGCARLKGTDRLCAYSPGCPGGFWQKARRRVKKRHDITLCIKRGRADTAGGEAPAGRGRDGHRPGRQKKPPVWEAFTQRRSGGWPQGRAGSDAAPCGRAGAPRSAWDPFPEGGVLSAWSRSGSGRGRAPAG